MIVKFIVVSSRGHMRIISRTIAYYRSNGFVNTVRRVAARLRHTKLLAFKKIKNFDDIYSYMRQTIDDKHPEYKAYCDYSSCDQVIKYVAFYLPQFHPIPENNEWWGNGFTEWSNVTRAMPQYVGHNQPRQPGELGYYDLRLREVRLRQIELARNYGIYGFCYHYYWFSGKKLLDYPINELLNDKTLDFPFCINWANENWTRRWDGKESDILMSQKYSDDDYLGFIKDVSVFLKDERYIKIEGKPLLMVYRPLMVPDLARMVSIWRDYCRNNDIGEIFLVLTHSFDTTEPEKIGFDSAVEFSPNNMPLKSVRTTEIDFINKDFSGCIFDYKSAIDLASNYIPPSYIKYRCVCPSWDNEARKTGKGTALHGAKPSLYKKWLDIVNEETLANKDANNRFVFINAWNEWAEGAYLEPDKKFGYAYLDATRRALRDAAKKAVGRRILLVSHDAHPHGAQYLMLNMAKVLHDSMGFDVDMIVLEGGPLIKEYSKYATVHELEGCNVQGAEITELINRLHKQDFSSAITNTTVSGLIVPVLKRFGFTVVSLVHEMPQLIKDYRLQKNVKAIADEADKIVFAANAVKNGFELFTSLNAEKIELKPQGLYKKNSLQKREQIKSARIALRKRYNLPKEAKIILGVGYADYRKGIDIFVEAGIETVRKNKDVYFLWLGKFEKILEKKITKNIVSSGLGDHFIFPGCDNDTDQYYAGADIFALTSREDPFPSVVMEAFDALTPVVAFSKSGGSAELLTRGGGILVDEMTSKAFSSALLELVDNTELIDRLSREGKAIIENDFSFRKYVFDLAVLARSGIQRVSVVVPSYNYERYIKQRLQTIITQDYPIYEIIVLDDASTDKSISITSSILEEQLIDYTIIVNEKNSGSVFEQWKKGVDIAKGDYVWIAEADDFSNNKFLGEVMSGFESPGVVLSYCESNQVNESGKILANSYLDYTADICTGRWASSYVRQGKDEIIEALSIKNTIPNVSGAVFYKGTLKSVLDTHIDLIRTYRVAGDWLVYVLLLKNGNVAFSSLALNMHRRHRSGVTIGSFNKNQLNEIARIQAFVADEFDVPHEKSLVAKEYIDSLAVKFGVTL